MTDGNIKSFTFSHYRKFWVLDIQYSIYLGYKNNSNSVVQFYYKARKKKYRLSDFIITTIVSNVEYLIYSILYILAY